MKTFLTIVSLLSVFAFGLGCGATSTPYAPAPTPDPDGFYLVSPLLRSNRVLAAVDPGTNMTADQLRVYFAVNMTKAIVQPMYWCPVYKQFMATFVTLPDATIYSWAAYMESQGYDVPNAPPAPQPIC